MRYPGKVAVAFRSRRGHVRVALKDQVRVGVPENAPAVTEGNASAARAGAAGHA